MQGNNLLSVVAPVYNEEALIEKVVNNWQQFLSSLKIPYEIVLANDGSTDGTKDILEKLAKKYKEVRFFGYLKNRGYGYALDYAIKNSRGNWIITIDSDGQFEIKDVKKLWEIAGEEKEKILVTGFRDRKKDSLLKYFFDRSLNLIVKVVFKLNLRDNNCALKLIPGDWLRNIKIESVSFSAPTEICLKANRAGFTIREIKAHHYKRSQGSSKLKPIKTAFSFIWFLIYLKLKFILADKKIINIDF